MKIVKMFLVSVFITAVMSHGYRKLQSHGKDLCNMIVLENFLIDLDIFRTLL